MQSTVNQDRDKYIGGSDIPIIMGISPFKTRYELLKEKANIETSDFDGNEYTEYGNIMESKIRDFININEPKNLKFIEGQHIDGDIRCHTDGENEDTILEIKTTSQIYENVNDYKVYLVQLLFYMYHTRKSNGLLAVYERPEDFNEEFDSTRLNCYQVKIDDYEELITDINNQVDQFREDLERIKENPLLSEEDFIPLDVRNLANSVITLENKISCLDGLKKDLDSTKEKLYESMVKYGIKNWTTPNGTLITKVNGTEDSVEIKFNEEKFKKDNKKLYNKYLEEKLKKGRKGYVRITIKEIEE